MTVRLDARIQERRADDADDYGQAMTAGTQQRLEQRERCDCFAAGRRAD